MAKAWVRKAADVAVRSEAWRVPSHGRVSRRCYPGRVSKAFTSEETPDTTIAARTAQPAPRGAERPITPDGYRALIEELRGLIDEELPRARSEAVAILREPRIAEVERRIGFVQATLASVRVVDAAGDASGAVRFGSQVTVEWENGRRQAMRLVGPDEVDVKAGRISIESPLARSLLGRVAGDEVEIERPRGVETARVVSVS